MRDDNASALRQALVDQLKRNGFIRTPRVEAAFRAVPRHVFVPDVALDEVYRDQSIPTKYLAGELVSSSSQPAMMAIMLEQLALEPGYRVLEIGAGTGYNAALIAHIVGDTGEVITVDIDEDLVAGARDHLAAAGFDRVRVVCGDGGLGYSAAAPYDRIILSVGSWDIAPAWREQLKPGGRLVLPLSIKGGVQASVAFEEMGDHLESVSVAGCGFMMLRGAFTGPETTVSLGPDPGVSISTDDRGLVDAEAVYRSLTGPRQVWPTHIHLPSPGGWGSGLGLWLAVRESGFCWLSAEGQPAEHGIVPALFTFSSTRTYSSTMGLLSGANLCVLMRPPDQSSPAEPSDDLPPYELYVCSFGPAEGEALARRLIEHAAEWDAAGRPSVDGLHLRAYPRDADYVPSAHETIVQKHWTRLVLEWTK